MPAWPADSVPLKTNRLGIRTVAQSCPLPQYLCSACWYMASFCRACALSTWTSLCLYSASWVLTGSVSLPRFIQGSAAQNPYSFYHWQYIDIFVYFSHHTVTIPPVGWTNAAHRHGVCMLGKSQRQDSHSARLLRDDRAGLGF